MSKAPEQSGLPLLLVVCGMSVVLFGAAFRFEQPALIAASGLALIAVIFAWSQPFIICSLFIAFSYFRLPEAYPSLEAFKPALLLGSASLALVGMKGLLSPLRGPANSGALKAYCMVSLAICIGLAVPYSALRASGTVGYDAVMIPAIMLSAAFCAAVWTALLSNSGDHALPVNVRIFAAFFIFICIDTIFSRVPGDSFDWWASITWKISVMTLASAWLARNERDLLHASNIFIVSGVLVAAVVIYNKMNGISLVQGTRVAIGWISNGDLESFKASNAKILSDPNDLALILMFPLAFALARVVHRRNLLEGILAAAACAATMLAIVFTQSRGAAIGIVVVFVTLFLSRYRSAVLGLIAMAAIGPLLLGAMNIANRDHGGFAEFASAGLDQSAQHRIDAWKTSVNMAAAHPLTGVGISNFSQMYYSYTNYWHNREIAVHSMWFQVLGELGLIGFALFVAMIWTSFTVNAQTIRWLEMAHAPAFLRATATGLQAALAGTCASGTFLSQAYTWPVYVIVALIAALANQAKVYEPAIKVAQHGEPVGGRRSRV